MADEVAIELYVSDDGDVIYKEYEGRPDVIMVRVLADPLPLWKHPVTDAELLDASLKTEAKAYFRMRVRAEPTEPALWSEHARERALKLLERLIPDKWSG